MSNQTSKTKYQAVLIEWRFFTIDQTMNKYCAKWQKTSRVLGKAYIVKKISTFTKTNYGSN